MRAISSHTFFRACGKWLPPPPMLPCPFPAEFPPRPLLAFPFLCLSLNHSSLPFLFPLPFLFLHLPFPPCLNIHSGPVPLFFIAPFLPFSLSSLSSLSFTVCVIYATFNVSSALSHSAHSLPFIYSFTPFSNHHSQFKKWYWRGFPAAKDTLVNHKPIFNSFSSVSLHSPRDTRFLTSIHPLSLCVWHRHHHLVLEPTGWSGAEDTFLTTHHPRLPTLSNRTSSSVNTHQVAIVSKRDNPHHDSHGNSQCGIRNLTSGPQGFGRKDGHGSSSWGWCGRFTKEGTGTTQTNRSQDQLGTRCRLLIPVSKSTNPSIRVSLLFEGGKLP